MPVITCPDCGREVSTIAPACPHCGRPSPGLSAPAGAVGAAPVASQEETLWRGSPSLAVLLGHVVMMLVVLVGVPFIASLIADKAGEPNASHIRHFGWLITLVILIVQLISFFIALMKQRSTVYTVTNQRIMIEQGVFSKSLSEIDLRYVDESEFFQSFAHRLLGIGNVILVSSDKVFPTTTLRSIKDPRGVRELIRSHAYQVSQRQLFTRAT
jgi:membrane protein YdbS with pleckstrin-like domain